MIIRKFKLKIPGIFKKMKKTRLRNKETIETINFLVSELSRNKNVIEKLHNDIRDLNRKNDFLMQRDNKLQEIEQLFTEKEIDISKLSKIIRKKEK